MNFFKTICKGILDSSGYQVINKSRRWGINHIDDVLRIVGDQKKIRTIFDVGANVGSTSNIYSARFPESKIIAIEPVKETFERLRINCHACSRITPVCLALADRIGTANCVISADSKKNTLLSGLKDELHSIPIGSQEVRVSTLDQLLVDLSISELDLLKIDTEGFDLTVLQGSKAALSNRSIAFIYFEFHQLLPRKTNSELGSLIDIAQFLDHFGYRFITAYTDSVHGDEPIGTYNALFLSSNRSYRWQY